MNFFENKHNRVITAVCLLIAATCAYFMQDESLFRKAHHSSSESIGYFDELRREVRKKNISNYFWDDLNPDDLLNEGDSVYTGSESSVTVKLSNGQVITVAPNTLIKFSSKDKKMVLDIPYGGVKLENVVDDIVISDCGEDINLNKDVSSVNLKKSEKCGSVKIDTKSEINTKNFEERKNKNDIVNTFTEVADSGTLDKIERTIASAFGNEENLVGSVGLSAPRLEDTAIKYTATAESPQVLKWSPIGLAKSYVVEVSDTYDFAEVEKFKTNAPQHTLKKLSSNMFFRVKAIGEGDEGSSYSEVGRLEVEFPAIKMDKLKVTKEYRARNPKDRGIASTAVDVTWSKVPYADKYVVELLDTKNNPVKKLTTREPASALEVPQTGTYSYQVHAVDSKGRKISSSDIGEVVYNKVFNILAPIIKQGMSDKFYFFQKDTAKYVWLNWIAQGDLQNKFRIEIARDKKFSQIIKSSFTTKPKLLVMDQVEEGEYFWRVRSEEDDRYSNWSNTEMFKIQINNQ
jgi:hypothetical protein